LVIKNRKVNKEIKKIKKQTKGHKKPVKKRKHRSSSSTGTPVPSSQMSSQQVSSSQQSQTQPQTQPLTPTMSSLQTSNGNNLTDAPEESSPISTMSSDYGLEGNLLLAPIPPSLVCPPFPERPPGCYLRSSQATASMHLNSRQNKKLDQVLTQLSFKKAKPLLISSGIVSNMYDQLRRDIVTMMNLEKHLARRECHRDNMRLQTYKPPSVESTGPKQKKKRSSKGSENSLKKKKSSGNAM